MTHNRPLILSLSLLAVLVGLNAQLYAYPPHTTPIAPAITPASTPDTTTPDQHLHTLARDLDKATLIHAATRPLFSPTRRPFLAPVAMEPVAAPLEILDADARIDPPQPPNFALVGIHKSPQKAMVLVQTNGTSDALWLSVGGTIDQWNVTSIGRSSVDLTRGPQTVTLELYPSPPALPRETAK